MSDDRRLDSCQTVLVPLHRDVELLERVCSESLAAVELADRILDRLDRPPTVPAWASLRLLRLVVARLGDARLAGRCLRRMDIAALLRDRLLADDFCDLLVAAARLVRGAAFRASALDGLSTAELRRLALAWPQPRVLAPLEVEPDWKPAEPRPLSLAAMAARAALAAEAESNGDEGATGLRLLALLTDSDRPEAVRRVLTGVGVEELARLPGGPCALLRARHLLGAERFDSCARLTSADGWLRLLEGWADLLPDLDPGPR